MNEIEKRITAKLLEAVEKADAEQILSSLGAYHAMLVCVETRLNIESRTKHIERIGQKD